MKRFLNSIFILFIFFIFGFLNVKAAEIRKENGSYKFSWSNLNLQSNSDYMVECSNAQITEGDTIVQSVDRSGNIIKGPKKSGFVIFKPTITNGTVTCKVYKNDAGKPAIDSASITIGTTTTTTSPTTTTPTTTSPSTTTTTSNKSNNANLKTLEVKDSDNNIVILSPVFSSSVYEYSATVDSSIKMVNIDATMEDAKSNLVISSNANEELKAGENNKITLTVTAEDGTKKAYVLNIKREALTADATLKSLKIKEDPSFKLKSDEYQYKINVSQNVSKLNFDYVTNDENASVTITGNEDIKDGSKVKLLVTAEDGTKKEYTITVSKEKTTTKSAKKVVSEERNPLIIMVLSIVAFCLIGSIVYVAKK